MPRQDAPGVDRRRRLAKACDRCRLKKMACDGRRPTCSRCRTSRAQCVWADVSKPERRRNAAARSAGLAAPMQMSLPSHVRTPAPSDTTSSPNTENHNPLGGVREQRYFGPSCAISVLPLQGSSSSHSPSAATQGNNNHGDNNDAAAAAHIQKAQLQSSLKNACWSSWTHPSLGPVFDQRRIHQPLPPWSEASALVHEYFESEHHHGALPIFHPPAFAALLGRQYSDDAPAHPAWWLALNAVLAMAQRSRVETRARKRRTGDLCKGTDAGLDSETSDHLAWQYAANATDAVVAVLMRDVRLLSVQAVLALCAFYRGTPNPQPAYMLASSAVRLAQSLGLHKGGGGGDGGGPQTTLESRTRNNVFWCALILDQSVSFRVGRPSAQDLSDLEIELPSWSDDGDCGRVHMTMHGNNVPLFRAHAELCLLRGEIYRQLYSESATTDQHVIEGIVIQLSVELDGWMRSRLGSSTGSHDFETLDADSHPSVIYLHYAYHDAVIAVNRAYHRRYWTLPEQRCPWMEPYNFETAIRRCVESARMIAELSGLLDPAMQTLQWDVASFHSNAFMVLPIHILRRPANSDAGPHLQALFRIIQRVRQLAESETNTYMSHLHVVCETLYGIAFRACRDESSAMSEHEDNIDAAELPQLRTPRSLSATATGLELLPDQASGNTVTDASGDYDMGDIGQEMSQQYPFDFNLLDTWSQSELLAFNSISTPWFSDLPGI